MIEVIPNWHPLFVHFPIARISLSAFPTALFGWLASNTVDHNEAGHAAMLLHRTWALTTLLALTALAGLVYRHGLGVIAVPVRAENSGHEHGHEEAPHAH